MGSGDASKVVNTCRRPACRAQRAIATARSATEAFASWLREEAPKKTGPSGIGKARYTWYLRNVLLVPLSSEKR